MTIDLKQVKTVILYTDNTSEYTIISALDSYNNLSLQLLTNTTNGHNKLNSQRKNITHIYTSRQAPSCHLKLLKAPVNPANLKYTRSDPSVIIKQHPDQSGKPA